MKNVNKDGVRTVESDTVINLESICYIDYFHKVYYKVEDRVVTDEIASTRRNLTLYLLGGHVVQFEYDNDSDYVNAVNLYEEYLTEKNNKAWKA